MSLVPHNNPLKNLVLSCPHFTDEKIESQRGEATCSRSHNLEVAEARRKFGSVGFQSHVLSFPPQEFPRVFQSYIHLGSYKAGPGEIRGGEQGRQDGPAQTSTVPFQLRCERTLVVHLKEQPSLSKKQKRQDSEGLISASLSLILPIFGGGELFSSHSGPQFPHLISLSLSTRLNGLPQFTSLTLSPLTYCVEPCWSAFHSLNTPNHTDPRAFASAGTLCLDHSILSHFHCCLSII